MYLQSWETLMHSQYLTSARRPSPHPIQNPQCNHLSSPCTGSPASHLTLTSWDLHHPRALILTFFPCRLSANGQVPSAQTARPPPQHCGGEMPAGTLCAMPVASTTSYTRCALPLRAPPCSHPLCHQVFPSSCFCSTLTFHLHFPQPSLSSPSFPSFLLHSPLLGPYPSLHSFMPSFPSTPSSYPSLLPFLQSPSSPPASHQLTSTPWPKPGAAPISLRGFPKLRASQPWDSLEHN